MIRRFKKVAEQGGFCKSFLAHL